MSLNQAPLSEIYYIGMAKAAECVGCGNEIQDAIVTNGIKSPSWPLYYSHVTGSVRRGFKLTIEKSYSYLSEAYSALNMLDNEFEVKPFLSFLFLTVSHYNEFWYHELLSNRQDLLGKFQKDLDNKIIK
jgi:cAMP phosphodiesterase